jgi:hypothetical protein
MAGGRHEEESAASSGNRRRHRMTGDQASYEPGSGDGPTLAAFGGSTPHRCRIRLGSPEDADRAKDVLRDLACVATVTLVEDAEGTTLQTVGDPDGREQAPSQFVFCQMLEALEGASIGVTGFAHLDLVTTLAMDDYVHLATAWGSRDSPGPSRRQLEALAGTAILESMLGWYFESTNRRAKGFAMRRILIDLACAAAYNTPGSEYRLVEVAGHAMAKSARTWELGDDVGVWLEAADRRASLSRLGGLPVLLPEELVVPLFAAPETARRAAIRLARFLPKPYAESVVDGLVQAAIGAAGMPLYGKEIRAAALGALEAGMTGARFEEAQQEVLSTSVRQARASPDWTLDLVDKQAEPGPGAFTHAIWFSEEAAHEQDERIDALVTALATQPEITEAFREDREIVYLFAPRATLRQLRAMVRGLWNAAA